MVVFLAVLVVKFNLINSIHNFATATIIIQYTIYIKLFIVVGVCCLLFGLKKKKLFLNVGGFIVLFLLITYITQYCVSIFGVFLFISEKCIKYIYYNVVCLVFLTYMYIYGNIRKGVVFFLGFFICCGGFSFIDTITYIILYILVILNVYKRTVGSCIHIYLVYMFFFINHQVYSFLDEGSTHKTLYNYIVFFKENNNIDMVAMLNGINYIYYIQNVVYVPVGSDNQFLGYINTSIFEKNIFFNKHMYELYNYTNNINVQYFLLSVLLPTVIFGI